MKHLAIDATHVAATQPTGVENYTAQVVTRATKLLLEKGVKVSWIGNAAEPPANMPAGTAYVHSPYQPLWSQTGLLRTLTTLKPDLFFEPSGLFPVLYSGKTALTVHDLAVYPYPDYFTLGQRLRLRLLHKRNAQHSSLILTPSDATKKQVQNYWGIDASRIIATLLANALPNGTPEAVAVPTEFVLYLGRVEEKKNLITLVQALAECPGTNLVIAGKDGDKAEAVHATIAALPEEARNRIHLIGYVSDAQKLWLLQNATLFVVPGLAEGSSIPLLEAMQCGRACLVAKAGPLPELGAEAVAYIDDGLNVDAWKQQIEQLITDPKRREKMASASLERSKQFSWDTTAASTVEALLRNL